MNNPYLKIPCELAEFALRESKVREAQIYLTGLHLHSGKVRAKQDDYQSIANTCNISQRTVYDKIRWLLGRDWVSKDSTNGWLFFKSLNHVHQLEGWRYSRSALMFESDLKPIKPFLIGAFLASVCKSGNMGTGTERLSKRSESTPNPVSLFFIENALNVSQKTAYNYRKLAEQYRYIKMYQNLRPVKGISLSDVIQMKQNNIDKVTVPLFGSTQLISVKPEQLIFERGSVFVQLPNLIKPLIPIGKRNLRRFKHPKPILPCGSC